MFTKPGRKNRQYSYTPQFYDPEKEKQETGRRQIKFRRGSGTSKKSGRPVLKFLLSLAFIFYIIHLLSQIGR